MTKYLFITGGVISSLGKGLIAASIGACLKSQNISVELLKLDPYLNVDPGNMSPLQHGEVFVTIDGMEADLDLGHYERFSQSPCTRKNVATTGQIYLEVLNDERHGRYGGATIQVIPHITNAIEKRIKAWDGDVDVVIVEIGGTVGDIESLPFFETIRRMRLNGSHVTLAHTTLLPYVETAGELKTKPTQHSVKELQSLGLQPDILFCRMEQCHEDVEESLKKIHLFTGVKHNNIIPVPDLDSIYEMPMHLNNSGILTILANQEVIEKGIRQPMLDWIDYNIREEKKQISRYVGIVGKYTSTPDSYKSIIESLNHAANKMHVDVMIGYVDCEKLDQYNLEEFDCFIIPGGFGHRGVDGKIELLKFARENNIPTLGICLGMQLMVLEFARNVANLDVTTAELGGEDNVIIERRYDAMRLGQHKINIVPGTRVFSIYNQKEIRERHRHKYAVDKKYSGDLTNNGLNISGVSDEIEVVEGIGHKWYIGCQFHPEFNSTPHAPHPLFLSLLNTTLNNNDKTERHNNEPDSNQPNVIE